MDACDRAGALLGHLAKSAQPGFRAGNRSTRQRAGEDRGDHGGRSAGAISSTARTVMYRTWFRCSIRRSRPRATCRAGSRRLAGRCGGTRRFKFDWTCSEIQEGNYLSSENRLTLIHAELTLTSGDRQIWQTTPRARSAVPLAGSAGLPGQPDRGEPERSDEFERLLYKNARDQIDQKFRTALANMPPCPSRAAVEIAATSALHIQCECRDGWIKHVLGRLS